MTAINFFGKTNNKFGTKDFGDTYLLFKHISVLSPSQCLAISYPNFSWEVMVEKGLVSESPNLSWHFYPKLPLHVMTNGGVLMWCQPTFRELLWFEPRPMSCNFLPQLIMTSHGRVGFVLRGPQFVITFFTPNYHYMSWQIGEYLREAS